MEKIELNRAKLKYEIDQLRTKISNKGSLIMRELQAHIDRAIANLLEVEKLFEKKIECYAAYDAKKLGNLLPD